jgi:hypothetical protein
MQEFLTKEATRMGVEKLDKDMTNYLEGMFERDPTICSGDLIVSGHRLTVRTILIEYANLGAKEFFRRETFSKNKKVGNFGIEAVVLGSLSRISKRR